MEKSSDHKNQRRQKKESSDKSPTFILPNPYVSEKISRGNRSGLNPHGMRKEGDFAMSRGHNGTHRAGESRNEFLQRDTSKPKTSKQSTDVAALRRPVDRTRSAGMFKPAQSDLVPFQVKMCDFPELSGVSVDRLPSAPPAVKKGCSWTSVRRSQTPDPPQSSIKLRQSDVTPGQTLVTSWANVASQPPKKLPPPQEKMQGGNEDTHHTELTGDQQEDAAAAKKKRRKKKKKSKSTAEEEEESEEAVVYQEPPKFEDEEEFPGLTPASKSSSRVTKEKPRSGDQQDCEQNKEKPRIPVETVKQAQKTEKVSGKKSKVPVQLDIGNMLEVLEKKQQHLHKDKPVILSVGGGLPVVQKMPTIHKKPEKFAHNPLDSTSPLVKKGKQREVPKAKKPTPLKKVILKEREERKQRRLQDERGDTTETPDAAGDDAGEQSDTNATAEEFVSPTQESEDQTDVSSSNLNHEEEEETTESQVSCDVNRTKIHSRKFREYCSQMLSKQVDECVTTLLKELVRFQDRLYQKDPMKARMKRRIVMGLREVLKHLRLRKIKCIVISPNCERIQSKGGLDEALHTIIDTCREQEVPFVFALSRKALGRSVNKVVPVSVVGIFNYDGAQDHYHQMIALSSEARTAYEVMVSSLEQSDYAVEVEPQVSCQAEEEELQVSCQAEEEEPQVSCRSKEAEPQVSCQAEEAVPQVSRQAEELKVSCLTGGAELRPNIPNLEEPEYMKLWREMMKHHQEMLRSSGCDQSTEEEKS